MKTDINRLRFFRKEKKIQGPYNRLVKSFQKEGNKFPDLKPPAKPLKNNLITNKRKIKIIHHTGSACSA